MKELDWWIETSRKWIVRAYGDDNEPVFTTRDFGELLCYEIHENNFNFRDLAKKWSISLSVLGELIADHCSRLDRGE